MLQSSFAYTLTNLNRWLYTTMFCLSGLLCTIPSVTLANGKDKPAKKRHPELTCQDSVNEDDKKKKSSYRLELILSSVPQLRAPIADRLMAIEDTHFRSRNAVADFATVREHMRDEVIHRYLADSRERVVVIQNAKGVDVGYMAYFVNKDGRVVLQRLSIAKHATKPLLVEEAAMHMLIGQLQKGFSSIDVDVGTNVFSGNLKNFLGRYKFAYDGLSSRIFAKPIWSLQIKDRSHRPAMTIPLDPDTEVVPIAAINAASYSVFRSQELLKDDLDQLNRKFAKLCSNERGRQYFSEELATDNLTFYQVKSGQDILALAVVRINDASMSIDRIVSFDHEKMLSLIDPFIFGIIRHDGGWDRKIVVQISEIYLNEQIEQNPSLKRRTRVPVAYRNDGWPYVIYDVE